MNFKLNEDTRNLIKAFSLSGMMLITFYVLLTHLNIIGDTIGMIFTVLSPFVFGFFFTLILLPVRNIAEKKWLGKLNVSNATKRKLAVMIAMILMVFIIVIFFWLLIPQLISTFGQFVNNFSGYIDNVEKLVGKISGNDTETYKILTESLETISTTITKWLTGASGGFTKIVSTISNVVTVVINFLIGMIITMYVLIDSEKFKRQSRKLTYALLPKEIADSCVYVSKLTSGMFYKFIFGKALDSFVIAIICYIILTIMGMPYTVLIAVVVGITNMIPVFGPFIGAIPCLLILVMINWVRAVEFLIFIVILQQIDGNIIGPYILGDAVGLPTLWVMFAIIVGGAILGVAGMFIGVPVFAVIYTLIQQWANRRLEEKKIDIPSIEK